MSNCISCNEAPPPCACSSAQTCIQTPRNCSTCPQNICINLPDSTHHSLSAGLGGIVGAIIGATIAAILIILSLWIICKRNYLPNKNQRNLSLHNFHSSTTDTPDTSTSTSTSKSKINRSIFDRNPTHQAVIFLPSDDSRDPKSTSLESDDDPFSDIHSGVSIISSRPISNQASPYPTDDRDGPPKLPTPSDQNSTSVPPPPTPTVLVSNPNQRNSFIVPNTFGLPVPPPPSGNPSNAFKPIRPHRAPDLDLRLPGAKARIDADQPSPNHHLRPNDSSTDPITTTTTSSYTQNNLGSNEPTITDSNQSDTHSTSTSPIRKRLSGVSDTASHDSHLSSILDPAMIVTPVTLVRTASGRQAAVQRVALRGQEKARVVRLPPSTNPKPHVPSPLSVETLHPHSSLVDSEKFPETFKFTPSINLGLGSRLSWDPDSPLPTSTTAQTNKNNNNNNKTDTQPTNKSWNAEETPTKGSSNLNRNRSTAAYSTRSSVGSSSVCESFIMDEEEVEFPTVLGRSAAILAHRQSQHHQATTALDHPSSVSHHQIHMKALGRDRAISLSSIIGEEAARDSFNSSPPPLPPLPSSSPLITRSKSSKSSSSTLPEPFKPFAGQKPSSSERRMTSNHGGSSKTDSVPTTTTRQQQEEKYQGTKQGGTNQQHNRNPEYTKSIASTSQLSRNSTVSSIRSGYGSVLEGIPFNIGFNSESDDLFSPIPKFNDERASSSSSNVVLVNPAPISAHSSSSLAIPPFESSSTSNRFSLGILDHFNHHFATSNSSEPPHEDSSSSSPNHLSSTL